MHPTFLNIARIAAFWGLYGIVNPALGQAYDEMYNRTGPEVVVGGVTAMGTEKMYVVGEGDNLWDLSEEFFFDSMMWPALWSLNPQITNPHYIYPGDVLFIRPPGVKEEKTSLVWSASRYNESPKNLTLRTRTYGFIAAEDYQESGIIQFSREEKEYLSTYDEVYIEFTTARVVRPGDEYTIYRVERPIASLDEESDEPVGQLVKFLGVIRILDTSKPLVRGLVLSCSEEILRDDLVTGIFSQQNITKPVGNDLDVSGKILDSFEEIDMYGEHQYVFIDLGRNQGVVPGNRLTVLDRGDPFLAQYREEDLDVALEDFPWEHKGMLMVVESYDDHALAVIIGSIQSMKNGSLVRMFQDLQ